MTVGATAGAFGLLAIATFPGLHGARAPESRGLASLWPRSALPAVRDAGPDRPAELGVKFRALAPGEVVGVHFFKAPANSGKHLASLWTAAGQLLARASSTAETASGWQRVDFPQPVAVEPGRIYVASYHAPAGHFSVDHDFFVSRGVDRPPLQAPADAVEGPNGVFAYGPAGTFPTQGYRSSNYWVDVVFRSCAAPARTPVSIEVTPHRAAVGPEDGQQLTATGAYRDGRSCDITRLVRWESSDPATVAVGADGVATGARQGEAVVVARLRGVAGQADVTARGLEPAADEGPGGPLLVVTGSANGFSRYLAEILRTEGLNEFLATDISRVDEALLARHDLAILGDFPLTGAQAAMVADWVRSGGNLVAMRPDRKLAPLLGLRPTGKTIADGHLRIDTGSGLGSGFPERSLQFHGSADLYGLDGATVIAGLQRDGGRRTVHPAVTLHGAGRGQAAAFAYDLARSVVYTRQGNPAWSRQARSGGRPRRASDLFYGPAPFDPKPDWVDFSRIDIPQADEQQRLLANLVLHMNRAKRPLPRFWYLPSGHLAAVVMTGDDHAGGGTAGRFDSYVSASPTGCSVADWQCIRGTSYLYPDSPLTNAQALSYVNQGFEVSVHVNTGCADYTSYVDLDSSYARQLASFASKYTSVPAPATHRTHCIAWSDYDTQPQVELAHGIRLDTNYYYWPASWVRDRPGFMTGSALPMRFADRLGRPIDVFQVATQMTDESGQTYPSTIDALLAGALGSAGHYGVFAANMHTDAPTSPGSEAILAAAKARGVPVISALQLLEWLDARNGSSFASLAWDGGVLGFTVRAAPRARNLQAMVPLRAGGARVAGIARGPDEVPFGVWSVKGVQYAVFHATPGRYRATYR